MVDSTLRGTKGQKVTAEYPGVKTPHGDYEYRIPLPDYSRHRNPDKSPEELASEGEAGKELGTKYGDKIGDYADKLKEYSQKKADYLRKNGSALVPKGQLPKLPYGKVPSPIPLALEVGKDILSYHPPLSFGDGTIPPDGPPNLPPDPNNPPLGPDQDSICGKGPVPAGNYNGGAGDGCIVQIGIYKIKDENIPRIDENGQYWPTTETQEKIGIVKWFHLGNELSFRNEFGNNEYEELNTFSIDNNYGSEVNLRKNGTNWIYGLSVQVRRQWVNYVSKHVSYTFLIWSKSQRGLDGVWRITESGRTPHWYYLGKIECVVPVALRDYDKPDPVEPNDYDRKEDEDEMGCKWQKDEISYELPKLKIGSTEVGGNSISIDDGLLPLAQYLCKSLELMHNGIGLNLLDDKEFPVNLGDKDGAKIKPSSLAQLSQWQFDNVSSLVGLPVKNTITNLDNDTKDLQFKNINDCLSYLVHKQRESDNDLMVIENYATRIATQLEAVTSIALRQHADIEMIVQEMGFRFKWKTETRPCLYKTGMKDDDEKTGIMELFKGGTVSYPVRIWDESLDQRQIALKTNLYAEISAKSSLQQINSETEIPGLDARIKMGKESKESWLEWIKTVNEPEKGVVSGSKVPYIEEYAKGTLEAKKIKAPEKGLSLFMKPVEPKKASSGKPKTVEPTKP